MKPISGMYENETHHVIPLYKVWFRKALSSAKEEPKEEPKEDHGFA